MQFDARRYSGIDGAARALTLPSTVPLNSRVFRWMLAASLLVVLSATSIHNARADTVTGFRTAKFGENEAAVRRAMEKDLLVSDDQIHASEDVPLGTRVLATQVKNFAPLNGDADISYVMGAHCHCLIRVVINWQIPTDSAGRSQAFAGIASLAEALSSRKWTPDHMAINKILGDVKSGHDLAMVFFRGEDGASAVTLLGAPVTKSDAAPTQAASSTVPVDVDGMKRVLLIYDANVAKPDVMRVNPALKGF